MGIFTPRTTIPDSSDKLWINTGYGGYNIYDAYDKNGFTLPNCTSYAYGRFMEIMGATSCNLAYADAGQWWYYTDDGYSRGQTPQLGAVACWSQTGKAGHVGIVEKVNSDGSFTISNSAYGGFQDGSSFKMHESTASWLSKYSFQGFIYNPSVSGNTVTSASNKLTEFISEAKSHVGEKSTWTWNTLNCGAIEWCCAFIMACAMTVGGLLDVIIPKTYSCTDLAQRGAKGECNGQFVKGPRKGNNTPPQVGDLILFSDSSDDYTCYHVGIVCEVTDSNVETIEGNTKTYNKYTSRVALKSYSITDSKINGYFRPDWASVGGSATSTSCYALYDTYNTRADALVREVGYIKDNEISSKKSDILLSVINYTPVLSSMVSSTSTGDCSVNTDGIEDENCRICIEYFLGKGLNAAAACGICGNIYYESGFRTAVIEYGKTLATGGAGICQWTGSRSVSMRSFVGDDWADNLTGQLDYLWSELNDSYYSAVMNGLKAVSNDESGAKSAADVFVRKFEIPANVDSTSLKRQAQAATYFGQLVIQSTSSGTAALVNSSGQALSGGTTVEVPSSVNQTGIIGNYTYYDRSWASGSVQRTIYDMWVSAGKTTNRNIAFLNNCYLCATTLIFGTTGDRIQVVLEDNITINCILGDSKGSNPGTSGESGNIYGHTVGSGIDIIEWEALVSSPSQIDLTGWKGKKVSKIINYGSYIS